MLAGKNSRATRRELLSSAEPCLQLEFSNQRVEKLRLVERYVHLGSVVTHTESCLDDIHARARSCRACFQEIASDTA